MTEILPKKPLAGKLQVLFVPIVVVLVGLGCFGLGRLSVLEANQGKLTIYSPITPMQLAVATPHSANNTESMQPKSSPIHNFVASKNGTKYYPAGCSRASKIKPANEVWFETAQAAAAAGYGLATGCKVQ